MTENKQNIITVIILVILSFALISLIIEAAVSGDTITNNLEEALDVAWQATIGIFAMLGMIIFFLVVFFEDSITIEQYAIIGFIEFILITIIYRTRPSIYGMKEK